MLEVSLRGVEEDSEPLCEFFEVEQIKALAQPTILHDVGGVVVSKAPDQ